MKLVVPTEQTLVAGPVWDLEAPRFILCFRKLG